MLTEALKVALLFVMRNHVYTFNGIIKRQVNGGPIGLELTGVFSTDIHDLVGQNSKSDDS